MRSFAALIAAVLAAVAASAPLTAQSFTTGPCTGRYTDSGGHNGWPFNHQERACEIRRTSLPFQNHRVDVLNDNGSIEVIGEDRTDIALEAEVSTQASSAAAAQSLLHEISIATAGPIQAHGPAPSHDRNWSVSYRLRVPHRLAADLRTANGSLAMKELEGTIDANTHNGSLSLEDLAGTVRATTINGAAHITLAGTRWNGDGLTVHSTNGGLDVHLAESFSAHLIASTVNGGLQFGVPVRVQGRIGSSIDTTLGSGGATLRFETTNGHIALDKR